MGDRGIRRNCAARHEHFSREQCSQAPHTPSSTIQAELRERFELRVSISQINRVRAVLGFSNRSAGQSQGKKRT
jgi:hypothetical protein